MGKNILFAAVFGGALLLDCSTVMAGSQAQERLADSVRTAMSASIGSDDAIPTIIFSSTQERMRYTRWLIAVSEKLKVNIPELVVRARFLRLVWYESHRASLDPSLVLGLIQVESGFKKYVISSAGAVGYMQVMSFWVKLLSDRGSRELFRTQTNLRFGCVILRDYLDRENGDLIMALGRYNGSRKKLVYPMAVLAAARQWQKVEHQVASPEGI